MDPQVFIDIEPEQMRARAEAYHKRGWRFVNICGSTVPEGVELIYTFSDGEPFENLRMTVPNGATMPSVSDLYLNSFFFENETHDLYGVTFAGIAIDFGGAFYAVSVPTPMNPASAQAVNALAEARPTTSEEA
ncbi:MAG: NADH-quinone oxidoreductase subunit C [Coriobacteriales bacterium]|jgi:Ni,Fe-hydrogenase III component G|nr:NADH-quinone oxidoreductase subunit C [Coriobacteriales bacterium]